MAFDGKLLNRPSAGTEATVANALVVAYDGVYAPPPAVPVISPNGDGAAEHQQLAYKLVRPSTVSAGLVGPDGQPRLSDSGDKAAGVYSFDWNGRDPSGAPEPEGTWSWTVTVTDDLGRTSSAGRSFHLDNTLGFLSLRPSPFRPRAKGGKLQIAVKLTRSARMTVRIYSAGGTVVRKLQEKKRTRAGKLTLRWDGRNDFGRLVHRGRYQVRVEALSRFGSVRVSRSLRVQR
jgi:hypothetical protein